MNLLRWLAIPVVFLFCAGDAAEQAPEVRAGEFLLVALAQRQEEERRLIAPRASGLRWLRGVISAAGVNLRAFAQEPSRMRVCIVVFFLALKMGMASRPT